MKEFWNERYRESPDVYGDKPNVYFKEKLQGLEPGNLLLPGEGEGRNAIFAASRGWKVVAYDQSEVARENALNKAHQLNVKFDYDLIHSEQPTYKENQFDFIALIYFHLPLSIRKSIHLKIQSFLKPGGKLLIEGFGKRQLDYSSGGPKDLNMLYDKSELQAEFPDMEWNEVYDGELKLDEGEGHKGKAHVIRMCGKKN